MTESVSVTNQETSTVELHHSWLLMHNDAAFSSQVIEHPHIMVAREEMNLHSFIGQFGQFPKKPNIATRHQMSVAEPKVEHIAQQY